MNRQQKVAAAKAALEAIYSGDQSLEADALVDRFEDWGVEFVAAGRPMVDVELPGMST